MPSFALFGRNSRLLPDKMEAHLMGRYHLAIENSAHPLYFTEKLTDALLMGNHVFYAGHPESVSLFNTKTITPIDLSWSNSEIFDLIVGVMNQIRGEDHTDAARENRSLVLDKYNLHAQLIGALKDV
jgi:hypothetical protein